MLESLGPSVGPSPGPSEGFNRNNHYQGHANDPNEFSNVLSSPGLFNENSMLSGQGDIMGDFISNLKKKVEESNENN